MYFTGETKMFKLCETYFNRNSLKYTLKMVYDIIK